MSTDDELAADFDSWEADGEPEPDYDSAPPPLQDSDRVERTLRRLGRLQAEAEEVRAFAARQIATAQAWRDDRLAGIERAARWHEEQVEAWARATHREGGPKQVKLPSGVVRLTAPGAPRVVAPDVPDEMAAIPFVAVDPSLVRTKFEVDKNQAKRLLRPAPHPCGEPDSDGFVPHHAVTADGEVVPGIVFLVGTRDSFSLSVARSSS